MIFQKLIINKKFILIFFVLIFGSFFMFASPNKASACSFKVNPVWNTPGYHSDECTESADADKYVSVAQVSWGVEYAPSRGTWDVVACVVDPGGSGTSCQAASSPAMGQNWNVYCSNESCAYAYLFIESTDGTMVGFLNIMQDCSDPDAIWDGDNCVYPSEPVNGSCSATHYNCSAGNLGLTAEYSNRYEWWCNGTNGGSNSLCSEPKGGGGRYKCVSTSQCAFVEGPDEVGLPDQCSVSNQLSDCAAPSTCQDPNATNYGGPLPCTYSPGETCQDPNATNYGGPLPCIYCASGYGNSCTSSANICGQTNSGTIQCNGSCSATTPPDSSCPPDFSLSVSNAIHITLIIGGPVKTSDDTTITLTPLNGFNSNVTLSASSDISGATYNFATNPLTPSTYSSGSVFNITVPSTTTKGPHTITIQGVGGGLVRTVFPSVILNVESYNPSWIEF